MFEAENGSKNQDLLQNQGWFSFNIQTGFERYKQCIRSAKPWASLNFGQEWPAERVKRGAALHPFAAAITQPPPRQCRATAASVRGSRAARAAFPPSPFRATTTRATSITAVSTIQGCGQTPTMPRQTQRSRARAGLQVEEERGDVGKLYDAYVSGEDEYTGEERGYEERVYGEAKAEGVHPPTSFNSSSSSAATMFRGDISANPLSFSSPVSGVGAGVVYTPHLHSVCNVQVL
ncbi:hypothetical protein B0H13DRAFT_1912852 [Mycena leptocephala]|nr:hypothetical protein B0H13DRAFT_1912852 [Mycena leptocephala]